MEDFNMRSGQNCHELSLRKEEEKCEGACDEHKGTPRHVYSGKNPRTHEPWDWWYCQEAIGEDKRRGFQVTDFNTGEVL